MTFLLTQNLDAQALVSRGLEIKTFDPKIYEPSDKKWYEKFRKGVSHTAKFSVAVAGDGTLCGHTAWLLADDLERVNLSALRTLLEPEVGDLVNFTYYNRSNYSPDRFYAAYSTKRADAHFYLSYSPSEDLTGGKHEFGLRYFRVSKHIDCAREASEIEQQLQRKPYHKLINAPLPPGVRSELVRSRWLPQ